MGLETEPANYKYSISLIGKDGVNIFAIPLRRELKGYTGVVGFIRPNKLKAIICETKKAGDAPMSGEVTITEVECPRNSSSMGINKNLYLGKSWQKRMKEKNTLLQVVGVALLRFFTECSKV